MGGAKNTVVGVAGQWASGKSTAARTLVNHLGGQGEVIFISDRALLGDHVIDHVQRFEDARPKLSVDAAGFQRLKGRQMTVILRPGETLDSVDRNNLLFEVEHDAYDQVPVGACNFLDTVRLELGHQILARLPEGKPIVFEAGFGTNLEPRGENPFCHTMADLIRRLAQTGLEPALVNWIVIEASYITRSVRNYMRADSVPPAEFDRFAAAGGDLSQDEQRALESQGVTIMRVSNQHSDLRRFEADVIAAYEEIYAMA